MKMLSSTLLPKSVRKVVRPNIITLSQTSFSTLTSESLPPNVTIVGLKGKPADLSFLKLEVQFSRDSFDASIIAVLSK